MNFIVALFEPPNYWLLIAVLLGAVAVFRLLVGFISEEGDDHLK